MTDEKGELKEIEYLGGKEDRWTRRIEDVLWLTVIKIHTIYCLTWSHREFCIVPLQLKITGWNQGCSVVSFCGNPVIIPLTFSPHHCHLSRDVCAEEFARCK